MLRHTERLSPCLAVERLSLLTLLRRQVWSSRDEILHGRAGNETGEDSLVFSHRGPLAASATPSPGLGFDYDSEHLEHQRSPTAQGLSKSKTAEELRQRAQLT
jgi:hypothetical protein